jgi:hypothetical protein
MRAAKGRELRRLGSHGVWLALERSEGSWRKGREGAESEAWICSGTGGAKVHSCSKNVNTRNAKQHAIEYRRYAKERQPPAARGAVGGVERTVGWRSVCCWRIEVVVWLGRSGWRGCRPCAMYDSRRDLAATITIGAPSQQLRCLGRGKHGIGDDHCWLLLSYHTAQLASPHESASTRNGLRAQCTTIASSFSTRQYEMHETSPW